MRCSVVCSVTLRLLVINISSSSPAINKLRHLLPAVNIITCGTVVQRRHVDNIWPVSALTALSEARYRLRIATSAYPPAFDAPVRVPIRILPWYLVHKKLEWLPMVKKIWRYVYSFWHNPRMWQTHSHTETEWRLIPHLHSIARQKHTSAHSWMYKQWWHQSKSHQHAAYTACSQPRLFKHLEKCYTSA